MSETCYSALSMTLRQFLDIVEIRTKIVSLSGLLIGSLAALLMSDSFSWQAMVLMWLASLAVDMGTTAFNSFFGWYDGSDSRRFNQERDKILVHAGFAPGVALLTGVALYFLAAILGLILASLVGWWLVPVGILCFAVGFFYNGGPRPISHTPLGECFAGGFLGMVLPFLTMLAISGLTSVSTLFNPGRVLLLVLPSGLMVASILTVNNTCDIEGDRQAGRRTLSILLGRPVASWLIPALGLAAWLVACANCLLGTLHYVALPVLSAGALLTIRPYRRLMQRGFTHATKGPSMGGISRIFQIFSVSLAAAMVISL